MEGPSLVSDVKRLEHKTWTRTVAAVVLVLLTGSLFAGVAIRTVLAAAERQRAHAEDAKRAAAMAESARLESERLQAQLRDAESQSQKADEIGELVKRLSLDAARKGELLASARLAVRRAYAQAEEQNAAALRSAQEATAHEERSRRVAAELHMLRTQMEQIKEESRQLKASSGHADASKTQLQQQVDLQAFRIRELETRLQAQMGVPDCGAAGGPLEWFVRAGAFVGGFVSGRAGR